MKIARVPLYMLSDVEIIGHQCADLGKCHHECKVICFSTEHCSPLTGATWLKEDWSLNHDLENL